MKRLITTIAAGEVIDYRGITISRMKEYAHKVGADFWEIDHARFGDVINADTKQPGNPSWWKIPLIEWMATQQTYDRMLYLDADVFVKRDAPDFFQAASDGWDGIGPKPLVWATQDMNAGREFPLWQEWVKRHYGKYEHAWIKPVPGNYMNAGVWATTVSAAAEMLKLRSVFPDIHDGWLEQHYWNMWLRFAPQYTVARMSEEWNVPFPYATQDHTAGHFLHLCGLAQQNKMEWMEKLEALGI